MLQKLNERIQGAVAWIVIILIAFTFVIFGLDYYMQSHQASNAEVEVNNQTISKQSFELNYRRARQQRDGAEVSATSEQALKKSVLDEMIKNTVTVQAAQKSGFTIGDTQADAAIVSIPQFQEDGHFSAERYQQALSNAMFTHASFQSEVRQGMLLNQQRFAFIGSAFALPEDAKRFAKLYMQTRDYSYLQIPLKLFMKKESVSDEAIANYYKANQKQFMEPEKVSVDFIRLSMKTIKDKIKINDEDIQNFYDENKNNFLTPAKWQLAHILFAYPKDATPEMEDEVKVRAEQASQSLEKNPSQFEALVKSSSDDKLSAAQNGVLPWITAGQSGFDKELVSLTKPGQISAPIKTEKGYEIFKLRSYLPSTTKTLAEVKESIKDQLAVELAEKQYADALGQLNDLSYQHPDSLKEVSEELNLPIEKSEVFSKEGGQSEIAKNRPLVNAAFSHDVLELGNNSEPLQLDGESIVVLRVNQHINAKEKPLSEVKDYISQQLMKVAAEENAKNLGLELLSDKDDDKAREKLVQTHQLKWQKIEKATRDTEAEDPAINDLAFSLAKENNQNGRRLSNGDYVIVRLLAIHDGQLEKLDKEQQASLIQQIEASSGLMDYDLYVNSLLARAKIEKP